MPGRESRRWSYRERLAPRHAVVRIESRRQIVALLQKLPLCSHDTRLCLYISLHGLFKSLHRPLGNERIAIELKAQGLALIGLIGEGLRGR
jgi:hypothetical protein